MVQYAFVIKNFSPLDFKVKILHSTYGKITCAYPKDSQAKLLTIGSLIVCNIELIGRRYSFSYLDIIYSPMTQDLEKLEFFHQIMLICLRLLPDNVQVDDIFIFLMDVYKNNIILTLYNKKSILLRLFFLSEIFEQDVQIYKLAMQDPFIEGLSDSRLIDKYLDIGFHILYQQKNLEN
ncbi:hypothetical protein HYV10_00815 [Candidatus Dependentiae bacterium]|nr:hypothetical protein [Candidatus Dependentiae bacterium]